MAHPYAHARAHHHERAHGLMSRTGNKVPHRAAGGHVHSDEAEDAAMIEKGVHEHESHMHKGEKKTKLKFKEGGHVEGEHAKHHLGRRARGGAAHKGKHVTTNVIVAPQGGGPRPVPVPVPARPAPAMAPAMAPHPVPAAPPPMPPGGPAGGPPMGMRPPGAMKRGGGVQKQEEVGVPSEALAQAKRGGHVRKRDVGGSAGVPVNPTQMSPQQVARIAQIRREEAAARQAAPSMQGPMGAAEAARMTGMAHQKHGGEVKVREHTRRAAGGHVPHMEAGAGGGEGRIEKMHEYGEGGFKPKKLPLHA